MMALVFFSVGPKNNIPCNIWEIISLFSLGIGIEYVFDKNMSVEKKIIKTSIDENSVNLPTVYMYEWGCYNIVL